MSFPSGPTLTAVNVPAPQVQGTYLWLDDAEVAVSPPSMQSLRSISEGDTTVLPGYWNRNVAGELVLSQYGAGAYGVIHGLDFSTAASLTLPVAEGGAIGSCLVQLKGGDTLAVPDNSGPIWIWMRCSDSALSYVVGSLAPPDADPWVFLGSCTTLGGVITAVDNSGVVYCTGGISHRYTADPMVPADVPSSSWRGITKTLDGHYYWNGSQYLEMPVAGAGVRTRKVTFAYGAFAAAATVSTINLATLPPGAMVRSMKIKHSTPFTGGAVTACTLELGNATILNKYATAFNVFQAAGATILQFSNLPGFEDHASSAILKATLRTTGANTNALTAGSVDIWLTYNLET